MKQFPIPKPLPGNPLTATEWCLVRALIEQGDQEYICLAIDYLFGDDSARDGGGFVAGAKRYILRHLEVTLRTAPGS